MKTWLLWMRCGQPCRRKLRGVLACSEYSKEKFFELGTCAAPKGTAKYLANYPRTVVRQYVTARRRNAVQSKFDREFNVDTAGLISLAHLDVDSPNWIHGQNYGPTSPATFEAVMNALSIDVSKFTFIDFGSGKGAALLYALAFPFQKIIGVEFSLQLHRCAESNIARYPLANGRAIRSIHCDAAKFEIPREPLVTYFHNPFSGVIMDAVLTNIRSSLQNSPRAAYVCTVRIEDDLSNLAAGDFLSPLKEGLTPEKLTYRIYAAN